MYTGSASIYETKLRKPNDASLIIVCINRAGFCSIREDIGTSPDILQNSSINLHDYVAISRLHSFELFKRFGGNFEMNVSVTSFSPLLIFFEVI